MQIKGKLVGVLSEEYINANQKLNYKFINNEKPNSCLIHITSNNSLDIREMDAIMNIVKNDFNNIDILYGLAIDNGKDNSNRIRAILIKN